MIKNSSLHFHAGQQNCIQIYEMIRQAHEAKPEWMGRSLIWKWEASEAFDSWSPVMRMELWKQEDAADHTSNTEQTLIKNNKFWLTNKS